jgi:2,4-dienoyl-CoA reductase-like NADH-dependent reductase (Old Yellow Enzyme family)
VSRYFKYKTAADLRADMDRLGLALECSGSLRALFQSAEVGGRTVGNRLVIQPMEGCDGEPDGRPGPLTVRRYERFGAGGGKLIWGEACAVVPEGRANPRQLVINESTTSDLARMLGRCREEHRRAFGPGSDSDLLVGLQLTHSGRYSHARPIIAQHDPLLDPRTIMDRAAGKSAGPDTPLISDDDLRRLQDAYVVAARRSRDAGFDFIDIKQCHRYLLNELLAARTRPGLYGGPFENRTRFILELIERVRGEVPDLIVATRMNVFDGIPYRMGPDQNGEPVPFTTPMRSCWGTTEDDPFTPDLDEPIRLVGLMIEKGLALLNVTLGNPYASPHLIRPFEYAPPDGYETPEHPLIGVDRHVRLTEEIQRAYPSLPVVGSGYSWLQAFAFEVGAANVESGRTTFVGIGRGSLSQPDFAARLQRGEPLDRKRVCRTFSYCTALMRSKHNEMGQYATGCPPFDKEVYGPLWEEAQASAPSKK